MRKHAKQGESDLSIIEAVETLSNIADMGFEREIGISETHDMTVQGQKISYHSVHWLRKDDADATIEIVKDTFRVILQYLKNFYKKEFGYITNQQTIEGIKTIMVLVGEAAKKLDKYTTFFKDSNIGSATELKEYKQLQEFYHKKINRKIDEGVLGRWILALTNRATALEKPIKVTDRKLQQTKHVFVDLESVKKDTEYELFFMRKEDGTRFFNPRLIRNIKLVCDFGDYFGTERVEDPFKDLQIWQDRVVQGTCINILKSVSSLSQEFYHDVARIRDHELISDLKMALMALMMGANSSNLAEHNPIKTCTEYFADFQCYLRNALNSRDFQKLVAYPPKKQNRVGIILLEIIRKICYSFFINSRGVSESITFINNLILLANQYPGVAQKTTELKHVWNELVQDYQGMNKMLKLHPNGPLIKVLDFLQISGLREFDVLNQHNIPNHWFNMYISGQKVSHERIPCPTRQEFIHKVTVVEEFKEFLREYNNIEKRLLIFNLQDRTSWREHFRSVALEDLQGHPDFSKCLDVVTLTTETDFYHQLPPYNNENHADVFMKLFKEQLEDESGGCFFPAHIKKALFPDVIDKLMKAVHKTFFSGKNVLLRDHRLDFIQIFFLFLELKIVELTKADSFSFSCKDGIDVGGANTALLFILLSMLNEEKMSEEEYKFLNIILYSPELLIRERIMLPERFNRMIGALKVIEQVKEERGFSGFVKEIHQEFGAYTKIPLADFQVPEENAA